MKANGHGRPRWALRLALLLPLLLPLCARAVLYEFTMFAPPGITQANGGPASLLGPITITGIGDTANVDFGPPPQFPTVPEIVQLPLDRLFFSGPSISGEFVDAGVWQRQQASPFSVGVSMGGTTFAPFSSPSFGAFNFSNPAPMEWLGYGLAIRDNSGPFVLTSGDILSYSYLNERDAQYYRLVAQPAVPEPGAVALWVAGLIVTGVVQRQSRALRRD